MKAVNPTGSVYTCFESLGFAMPPGSSRVYFVVSGEHPTLPLAELEAIHQALRINHRIRGIEYKLVSMDAEPGTGYRVGKRAGFTEEAGVEILESTGRLDEIADAVKKASIRDYLEPGDTFSVRVARFGGVSTDVSRVRLERLLGELMVDETGAKVNLRTPHRPFRGILTGHSFHLGLVTYQRPRGTIANRRPRKRPVFHPSTMVPKLARCMVNLSQPGEGATFLDPFCGVGGILLEASLIGCQAIGLDAINRMVKGATRNLSHYGVRPLGLLRGDARHIPVRKVDAIATDPPYGTGASTLKSTTRQILDSFLPQARAILPTGHRAVIASPLGTGTSQAAEKSGFRVLDHHQVYVHRSLTREILVLGAA